MRFTVGKKIGGGFSVVVILLLIVFLYTFSVVNVAIKSNDKFLKVDQPEKIFLLNELKFNFFFLKNALDWIFKAWRYNS